jgi:hypothetical protein
VATRLEPALSLQSGHRLTQLCALWRKRAIAGREGRYSTAEQGERCRGNSDPWINRTLREQASEQCQTRLQPPIDKSPVRGGRITSCGQSFVAFDALNVSGQISAQSPIHVDEPFR